MLTNRQLRWLVFFCEKSETERRILHIEEARLEETE